MLSRRHLQASREARQPPQVQCCKSRQEIFSLLAGKIQAQGKSIVIILVS
jgi:hypothetical protein